MCGLCKLLVNHSVTRDFANPLAVKVIFNMQFRICLYNLHARYIFMQKSLYIPKLGML